ncbi:histidine-rich glycoprotein [Cricetulus griseus]|uniref:histidine-rich glycoprotein n=1 Tax=Cricetulus griseus TaxID=10029 RepID=UPI00022F5C1A|nr:histidine-rich glycoprotein [Cricetulus griseus]
MGDHSLGWFSTMNVLTTALLLVTLQYCHALSPTNCDASEPSAERVLDLINKGRRNGYAFELLRVADAHLDRVGNATVYYLVLDVKESDCWVLSTKSRDACLLDVSRRPSEIVIGQCKVIATRYSDESQDFRVNNYNCTTSSVSSALSNTKDSPVLLDFFEDSEPYREQANTALDKYKWENSDFGSFRVERIERVIRARGGKRTNYYLDFSMRNCSTQHFPRHPPVFGFCRAVLSYDVEASNLETPKDTDINCEVFNFEDRNMSDIKPHWGHEHSCGKHLCKFSGSRGHHHTHKMYEHGYPPPPEGEEDSDRPPPQDRSLPQPPPRHSSPFGTNRAHRPPHNHSCNEHVSHRHPPHGHHRHGHPPHGHHPHGHPPHGHQHPPHGHHPHGHPPHGHHPHGHPPHGHPPHGHPPHGHHPHGHPPHGHHPHGHPPHGHDFHDYGPCDPPSNSQKLKGQYHGDHGPPHGHSRKRGSGKGFSPFHHQEIGNVYRLPPLSTGEVLDVPEANFPSISPPNCNNPLQPEIQSFPEAASKSCPGKFRSEFPQIHKFFANMPPK